MKLLAILCCILMVQFMGQVFAQEIGEDKAEDKADIKEYEGEDDGAEKGNARANYGYAEGTPITKMPSTDTTPNYEGATETTTVKPCGSNDLGDYKGGCDESVPVIVMPKGRPIMERVLDWFKCGTKACLPDKH